MQSIGTRRGDFEKRRIVRGYGSSRCSLPGRLSGPKRGCDGSSSEKDALWMKSPTEDGRARPDRAGLVGLRTGPPRAVPYKKGAFQVADTKATINDNKITYLPQT